MADLYSECETCTGRDFDWSECWLCEECYDEGEPINYEFDYELEDDDDEIDQDDQDD